MASARLLSQFARSVVRPGAALRRHRAFAAAAPSSLASAGVFGGAMAAAAASKLLVSSRRSLGCSEGRSVRPNEPVSGWCFRTQQFTAIHEAEARILERMVGTPYEVQDVAVPFEVTSSSSTSAAEYTIRTVIVGKEHRHNGKLPIVLIHGYMMGAPAFFKLLPLLAQDRTVYAIDIIGMGGSGRPPFSAKHASPEHAEHLLVSPFETWADKMGLSEFGLLGHSFGGFVASSWAHRQPERIRCLGLLSPLLGWSDDKIAQVEESMENSWFGKVVDVAWDWHVTPHSLVRRVPFFKGWFSVRNERRLAHMSTLNEEEGRLMSDYILHSMDMPPSTEKTVFACFGKSLRAADTSDGTIKERLSNLQMPIFAVNGDRDWMEAASNRELPNVKFEVLPGSGHHLYFDNPTGLAQIITNHLNRTEQTAALLQRIGQPAGIRTLLTPSHINEGALII